MEKRKCRFMRKISLKFRSLALVLAMVVPLLGLTLFGCTAQDAVDIAAGVAEVALEVLEEADAAEEEVPSAEEEPGSIPEEITEPELESEEPAIDENGSYDDKDNVALYIHTYGKLPPNYISKAEAEDLGWEGGSVERYAPGKCIGGAKFGNYEGLLPKKDGRQYYECDIDTLGESSRGAKRIVYSNDGLVYYTDDHYESFELLYGED